MMERYEKYKESGIEWMGEIPESWSVVKLKHVISCNDDSLSITENDDYQIDYIEIGDVSLEKGIINHSKLNIQDAPSRARRIVKTNDVIISTVRTYLKAISRIPEKYDGFIASTGFAVLRSKQIDPFFLSYMVQDEYFIGQIISLSVGASYPAINSSTLIDIKIPFPLKSEQTQIARYLDQQTATIDELIERKEKLIELLKEKRQAIINEAVTKGLNPKAKMKDSGIEWLGEVPEGWTLKKLKYLLSIKSGEAIEFDSFSDEHAIPLYGGNGIMGFTNKVSSEDSKIIIGRVGAHCGNVHLAHGKKWVSDNALIVETGQNLDYMSILLKSLDLNKLASKNAQPLITGFIIKDQIVPYPTSQVEQQEIVSFIKKHKLTSTLLLEKLLYQIEKLKEYRQSVISEAVTGKVDVRNWLPDKH